MGTFIVSRAMTKWSLDNRIALYILRIFGSRPALLMLGFILAAGFLSLWINNTATTAILVPTALAVLKSIEHPQAHRFRTGVLLSVAYASSVGGVGTLVGTAPTAIYAAFAATLVGHQVTFSEWLSFGLPFVVIFIPILWGVMAYRYTPRGLSLPREQVIALQGPMSRGEKQVAFVFAAMILLWLSRSPLAIIGWPGWSGFSIGGYRLSWANDSTVAMFGAMLLFALPVNLKQRQFALDLKTGLDISWSTLLLFGGGLALGLGIAQTGLAAWLAQSLQVVAKAGPVLLVLAVALMTSLVTEITSNTATCTMLMPVMFALGQSLGGQELVLMATAAVSSSMAFMTPIGTPPNAIAYGTGQVTMREMFLAGFVINMLAVLVWWGVAVLVLM
jgi:sodium-dependent dicarboxylate transporter 2/3/5